MPKVNTKRQITLPKKDCDAVDIQPGDEVEIFQQNRELIIIKKTPDTVAGILKKKPCNRSTKVHAQIKERHRELRNDQEYNLRIRVHRSLSWLERALMCEDLDGKLIFLWIAFNAVYAKDSGSKTKKSSLEKTKEHAKQHDERKAYRQFFKRLCELDKKNRIDYLIWNEFANSIRGLLNNRYIHPAFWEYQRGEMDEEKWKSRFRGARRRANECLKQRSTVGVLNVVFSVIYVLRNQLVHGGATWRGDVNREQIRDSARFLEKFVIAMLDIMVEEKEFQWEDIPYPPVDWNG